MHITTQPLARHLSTSLRAASFVAFTVAFTVAFNFAFTTVAAAATLQPTDDPQASPIWQKVRASLFENRPITTATPEQLTLEAPSRAINAAVVPIAIRTGFGRAPERYVQRLYLIIDANPSPISAIFSFTPDSGSADIETRVRVDEYSHVRAIAELSDGQLFATTRFVKASGGCSAAPGSDAAAALATLGQIRFRVDGDLLGSAPVAAQLLIDHPNHSGLAMDQASRQFVPAHFVRKVDVSYGGRPVLSADVDFSISENPYFRFHFVPRGPGELQASITDSRDLHFDASQALRAAPP
jgi:sulfur-oxidizing protein SoxY